MLEVTRTENTSPGSQIALLAPPSRVSLSRSPMDNRRFHPCIQWRDRCGF